ncbi:MAG: Kelch repeat-containing protein [Gammaproteobacteria bacterium]
MLGRSVTVLVFLLCLASCVDADVEVLPEIATSTLPALPEPVSNNAVAAVSTSKGLYLVSFNGLAADKQWDDTLARTYVLTPQAKSWRRAPDVPGEEGRLASIAVAVGEHAYVFGGYTVAEDHTEVSLPLAHRFDPLSNQFTRLADMPVPVDDAMALVYQQRYIYLISGWHDTANVNLVQLYDTVNDSWVQATAYPGTPVFGHSGGIVNNEMVVCGGVEIKTFASEPRQFVMNTACYAGTIREDNNRRIDWRTTEPMPGAARYRMAAVGSSALDGVVFAGGSDNPYNYDGVGYNTEPSEPLSSVWIYDLLTNSWNSLGVQAVPTIDHRGLLETPQGFITIGGMLSKQAVTDKVTVYTLP